MANNPKVGHSSTMTDAQIAAINSALETIRENMPFLVELSAEERNALQPINIEKRIFTENTIHLLQDTPTLLTSDFNIKEAQTAMHLYNQLDELLLSLGQLTEKIKDTQRLIGEETYLKALDVYNEVEDTAKEDSSVVDAVYAILRTSYQNQKAIATERQPVFDSYLGTW